MRASFAALVVFTFLSSLSWGSSYQEDCGAQSLQNVSFQYCLYQDPQSSSQEVLYVLHGAGMDARYWKIVGPSLEFAWEEAKVPKPKVAVISFGKLWLLVKKNGSLNSGLLELFVDQMLPWVENTKFKTIPSARKLLGYSLGAFNAAQVILQFPTLFQKAALACPFLMDLSPYARPEDILSYLKNSRAILTSGHVRAILSFMRKGFPNSTAWDQANPFRLIRKANRGTLPTLHVSCGINDELGVFKGAFDFAHFLDDRGHDVTFQSIPGGHCAADQWTIANFLK